MSPSRRGMAASALGANHRTRLGERGREGRMGGRGSQSRPSRTLFRRVGWGSRTYHRASATIRSGDPRPALPWADDEPWDDRGWMAFPAEPAHRHVEACARGSHVGCRPELDVPSVPHRSRTAGSRSRRRRSLPLRGPLSPSACPPVGPARCPSPSPLVLRAPRYWRRPRRTAAAARTMAEARPPPPRARRPLPWTERSGRRCRALPEWAGSAGSPAPSGRSRRPRWTLRGSRTTPRPGQKPPRLPVGFGRPPDGFKAHAALSPLKTTAYLLNACARAGRPRVKLASSAGGTGEAHGLRGVEAIVAVKAR